MAQLLEFLKLFTTIGVVCLISADPLQIYAAVILFCKLLSKDFISQY